MKNLQPIEIDKEIVKKLFIPLSDSHKGENGKVLIIGGSNTYHGATLLAAKIAGKIVDLVYFSSVPENNELIHKMKEGLCEFITVSRDKIEDVIKKVDAVLIGIGMEATSETKEITEKVLQNYQDKKVILDADSLKVIDPKSLHSNCIVTPHQQEFKALFNIEPTSENVFYMAQKYHCIVVLKGKDDFVSDGNNFYVNRTGNAGMTKGGTGDVLAGLVTALAAKNDLLLAALAGVYINGAAGDQLFEKVSYYFSASDIISEIPYVLKQNTKE